ALQGWMAYRARRVVGMAVDGPLGVGVHVVWFHSPTCGPCRAMQPAIDALASTHPGLHPVDVTVDPALAAKLGVMATPTTVRVADGTVTASRVGVMREAELEAWLAPG
ncbi:MAG: thioredoxin family protein, partial [Myxococcota bacterium]